jgi:hypothetical protein
VTVIVPGMTFFTTAFTTALCATVLLIMNTLLAKEVMPGTITSTCPAKIAQRAVVKAVVKKVMPGTITFTCPAKICQHFSFTIHKPSVLLSS